MAGKIKRTLRLESLENISLLVDRFPGPMLTAAAAMELSQQLLEREKRYSSTTTLCSDVKLYNELRRRYCSTIRSRLEQKLETLNL